MSVTEHDSGQHPDAHAAALRAAFDNPNYVASFKSKLPVHQQLALNTVEQSVKAYLKLPDDDRALVDRVRTSSDYLAPRDAREILRQLEQDLQRENRREIVAELRASAVSTAAVDELRAQALDWDALMAQPEQVPLVAGVLTEGALAALIGATGLGKSFLTLAWCLCVSTGTPWLGRAVQQRRVLYVVGEGADGLRKRAEAWSKQTGVVPSAEDFRVLAAPGRLDDPRTMRTLARMAADEGTGLVVLDTLSSLAPEAEKPGEAPRWLAELKALRESLPGTGTVLFVHHSGVGDPTRARNSSALEANPDEVLVLTSSAEKSPLLSLRGKKVKDGPDGWTIPLHRTVLGESCVIESVAGSSKATSPAANFADHPVFAQAVSWSDKVLNYLTSVGAEGATGAELRLALGVDPKGKAVIYDALTTLKSTGQVVSNGAARGARFYAAKAAAGAVQ